MRSKDKVNIKEYFQKMDIRNCLGVTLTMKQEGDHGKLTSEISSQNFRHFMNVLNRQIYKQKFKRYKKRLKVIPVIENSYKDRLHLHTIIEIPSNINTNEYCDLIRRLWKETNYGRQQVHIHKQINSGWTEYITKFKSSFDDVDWVNVHWD